MKHVYILRGLPSSGKSTLAVELSKVSDDSVICCADDYFYNNGVYGFDSSKLGAAHSQCFDKFLNACEHGVKCIIIANTNSTRREYSRYQTTALEHGYRVFRLIVERTHTNKNNHNVPDETLTAMRDRFTVDI